MEEIKKLLAGLKKEIDSGKEFPFWEYLGKSEKIMEKSGEGIEGTVEENVAIKGNLTLGKNSIIKSGTYIEGNVFIGENCIIGPKAYLRKGAVIADGCHIGNSEIKNSVILSNSKIPHYSYVGDSIIGENVNFGAGTKIANLRFDNKSVKVEINGKKIDSGRRKLGVLVGHNVKTGINSSINCGIIVGNNCQIYPGRVAGRNLRKGEIFK